MRHNRIILLTAIAICALHLTTQSAFCQSNGAPRNSDQAASPEEFIKAAHKAVVEGDWAIAELNFREALRSEPKQGYWLIQLSFALGQQKKWKEAFKVFDKVIEQGLID